MQSSPANAIKKMPGALDPQAVNSVALGFNAKVTEEAAKQPMNQLTKRSPMGLRLEAAKQPMNQLTKRSPMLEVLYTCKGLDASEAFGRKDSNTLLELKDLGTREPSLLPPHPEDDVIKSTNLRNGV